jgi:hypothetical protein
VLSKFWKQSKLTPSDIIVTPGRDHVGPTAKDNMLVVMEPGVGQAIYPKHKGQKLQLTAIPATTVLEGLTGKTIVSAEKRVATTTLERMKNLSFQRI